MSKFVKIRLVSAALGLSLLGENVGHAEQYKICGLLDQPEKLSCVGLSKTKFRKDCKSKIYSRPSCFKALDKRKKESRLLGVIGAIGSEPYKICGSMGQPKKQACYKLSETTSRTDCKEKTYSRATCLEALASFKRVLVKIPTPLKAPKREGYRLCGDRCYSTSEAKRKENCRKTLYRNLKACEILGARRSVKSST